MVGVVDVVVGFGLLVVDVAFGVDVVLVVVVVGVVVVTSGAVVGVVFVVIFLLVVVKVAVVTVVVVEVDWVVCLDALPVVVEGVGFVTTIHSEGLGFVGLMGVITADVSFSMGFELMVVIVGCESIDIASLSPSDVVTFPPSSRLGSVNPAVLSGGVIVVATGASVLSGVVDVIFSVPAGLLETGFVVEGGNLDG